jgi:Sporulation and spore germination
MTVRLVPKVAAVITLLALAGCAIQPDSAPRDIPDDLQERESPVAAPTGGAARGTDRIYLLAPDDSEHLLRTVQRDTGGDATELLTALISGPNPAEFERGYRTAVPAALVLRSVRGPDDGVVHVDVSDALLELSGGDLTDAVAQIVFTASEIPGAESVLIRVDGATREWPDGSGAQHRGPLTTYDFIGYAESSQPAFPVSPAPTTAVPPSTTTPPPTTTIAPTTTVAAPSTVPAPTAAATTTVPATTVAAVAPAPTTTAPPG